METNMIANRASKSDDHEALSRRLKVILVPALVALLAGFLISFAFSPRYTSKSLVLVERPTVPAGSSKSTGTASVRDRMLTLQQQVLSRSRLQALVDRRSDLASGGKNVDDVIDEIQSAVSVTEAPPLGSSAALSSNSATRSGDAASFYVSFTANNPRDAQQFCSEITSMLLEENLKNGEQAALGASDFFSRQLDQAKSNLDETDKKLAAFKNLYPGQLPSDVDNNLKILGGLNSQLDAVTWQLNRAQQDKSYDESVLAQQLAAWKSYRNSQSSDSIEQQLAALKAQLITLQARYTDDHPDVIKLKSDIAELEAKQKEMSPPSGQKTGAADATGKAEPPEILQLRQEIDQNEGFIAKATRGQKQLGQMISIYQSRLTLSPKVEEDYKQLTRDNETAYKIYDSLLLKKSESEIQTGLEYRQQGEQMRLLDAASLPGSPGFPVRWKFAACGLVAGLAFGIGIAISLELRHRAIRNDEDVLARLERPMLTPIPIASPVPIEGQSGFRGRLKALLGQKRTAGL
jgi:polysaccharide chain length determinant protein (PEP-CTERM system associated)